jgi:uncharacterized protein YndB with AHSA1/START domain
MNFRIVIERSIETVFEHIRDLAGYKSWLPASATFSQITDISDYPIQVGTTYIDRGPTSVMRGKVTEMEPPRLIAFQQAMNFKRGPLSGGLTISIRYTLEEARSGETRITRELRIRTAGVLVVLYPVLVSVIGKEDKRILQRMKVYLEARVI